MKAKLILPSLIEAESLFWRPIKYSLFPPLGLATLAAFFDSDDELEIIDQHVETLDIDDEPDLVIIQVYITNAYRAYRIADHYRRKGVFVILGGLHVTSLPQEASTHADAIFLGPGEYTFAEFLNDFRNKQTKPVYYSSRRDLDSLPPVRRDLIKRELYLVPNSIVVSRGCPHHCNFCYKDAFFKGGKSFYTQKVDHALSEIERLPGRHLYFLDDHLLAHNRFARSLFDGMKGMNRLFQGASTVDAIMRGDLIEKAVDAGLRSIFIGFETLSSNNLVSSNKSQSISKYMQAIKRLDDLGVMINGSFVFGLDSDSKDVFKRTVDWAIEQGITTSTFHIATPYPGTKFYQEMEQQGRILTKDWKLYDTRTPVFKPTLMSTNELKSGYDWSYKSFYKWSSIFNASLQHNDLKHGMKHFCYAAGWKKFEPLWNFVIKTEGLKYTRPMLKAVLSKITRKNAESDNSECDNHERDNQRVTSPAERIE